MVRAAPVELRPAVLSFGDQVGAWTTTFGLLDDWEGNRGCVTGTVR